MATQKLNAQQLAAHLAEERAVLAVQRTDLRERRRLDAEHRDALAEVAVQTTSLSRARRERIRDEEEGAALAELYRRAARSGARARIRTDIQRSAEMRALRVARVRSAALFAGVPILAAFGAWSTAGVQAGVVRLLGLKTDSAGWWAAWVMEPALMAVVALIIIGRAVLRSSGGDTDGRATVAEWTALGTSVALNLAGGWHGTGWDAFGGALAHSVGPVGAAGTAFLIGLFDSYVTTARPWDGAPRLADLDLTPPTPPAEPASKPAVIGRDDLEALVDVVTPTPVEVVERIVEQRLAELPAPVEPPVPPRPRWRPQTVRRPRRMGRPQPQITVVLPEPKPARRPAEPAAKTGTSAGGRGRPSSAQKVTTFAAKHPTLSVTQLAQKLKLSEDTIRRHLPRQQVAVNGHNHTQEASR